MKTRSIIITLLFFLMSSISAFGIKIIHPYVGINDSLEAGNFKYVKHQLEWWEKCWEWKKDGDYYATRFNYYLNQALKSSMHITAELPLYAHGTSVYTLQDTTEGKATGYMYLGYRIVDSLRLDSAIHYINLGIKRCPNRLDLYLGLASCYLYCDNHIDMIKTLERAMRQSKKNKNQWLWSEEETPPAEDILFDRIQEDFGRYLDAEMYENALRLTKMVLKYVPKRAEFHNNLAVIAYMRGDYNLALKHFQDANRLNLDDQIIIKNIQHLQKEISENPPTE